MLPITKMECERSDVSALLSNWGRAGSDTSMTNSLLLLEKEKLNTET